MNTFAWILAFLALAPATHADDFWGCEFNVSGDQTASVKAPQLLLDPAAKKTPEQVRAAGKVSATADYWLTDAQMHTGLDAMIGMISGITFGKTPKAPMSAAERKQKVDEAMKKDPRIAVLLMNCGNEQAGIVFSPGRNAKYADFPFHAGSYVIAERASSRQIEVMAHLTGPKGHEGYRVSGPGVFKLTQFDLHGLTGEFSFPAQQITKEKKKIQVTGRFHLHCVGEKCAK